MSHLLPVTLPKKKIPDDAVQQVSEWALLTAALAANYPISYAVGHYLIPCGQVTTSAQPVILLSCVPLLQPVGSWLVARYPDQIFYPGSSSAAVLVSAVRPADERGSRRGHHPLDRDAVLPAPHSRRPRRC